MFAAWEGVAERLREAIGIREGESEDPRVMAVMCGLRLAPTRMVGATLRDGAIYYDRRLPPAERNGAVAIELARWALLHYGLTRDLSVGATYLGALLAERSSSRDSGIIAIR